MYENIANTHPLITLAVVLFVLFVAFMLGYTLDHESSKRKVKDAEYDLKRATREAESADSRFRETAKKLAEMQAKIKRGEIFTKFDLSTAQNMGEFVDAFRVVRVSTKAKWAGTPAQPRRYDNCNEIEVIGFTENEHLARTYVERWDNVHSDFKQGYEVEMVRVFKLPNGDYLKALPFAKLPVLKPRDFSKERQVREPFAGDET